MLHHRPASKLRVLLVPITSHCYVLHANTVHSTDAVDGNDPNSHYPASRLTVKQIPFVRDIKSKRVRDRIDYQLKELHEFWEECEEKSESEPSSWKGRIFQYAENALQRIDGYESFLGSVPYKDLMMNAQIKLSYVIPAEFNTNHAMNHLEYLCKQRIKYHQKWLYLNICLLPFTALLGLLPGPNVFILYNGYRCYGHYRAYNGAIAIQSKQAEFEIKHDHYLQDIHTELKYGTMQEIDDGNMHKLQEILDCQHIYHHLHRVRYQIVQLNKYTRYQLITS